MLIGVKIFVKLNQVAKFYEARNPRRPYAQNSSINASEFVGWLIFPIILIFGEFKNGQVCLKKTIKNGEREKPTHPTEEHCYILKNPKKGQRVTTHVETHHIKAYYMYWVAWTLVDLTPPP